MSTETNPVEQVEQSAQAEQTDNIAAAMEAVQYSIGGDLSLRSLASINLYFTTLIEQISLITNADAETTKRIESAVSIAQKHMCHMADDALRYIELHRHHVIENKRLDSPLIFMFENLAASIVENSVMIDRKLTARVPAIGHEDERWVYEPLPTERLFDKEHMGEIRIPVKADTGREYVYGYLELFINRKVIKNKPVDFITEIPAIRIKNNYVIPNAIYRWMEINEAEVSNQWNQGTDIVAHPAPKQPEPKTEAKEPAEEVTE